MPIIITGDNIHEITNIIQFVVSSPSITFFYVSLNNFVNCFLVPVIYWIQYKFIGRSFYQTNYPYLNTYNYNFLFYNYISFISYINLYNQCKV